MGDDIVSILCYMSDPSICLYRFLRLCACYHSHMHYMPCMFVECANVQYMQHIQHLKGMEDL